MPAMRVFGRRCSLATDDFLVIGVIDGILFLPWLGWLPVVYASFLKNIVGPCDDTLLLLLHIYLPGICVLFILNWLLAASFILCASRGTISKPEPRRHVVTLVYVKLVISFLDAVWASLGTFILTRDGYFCDVIGVGLLIKACTAFQWLATVVRLWMMAAFYDWSLSKRTKDTTNKEFYNTPMRRGTFKKWNARLRRMFLWCTTPTDARKQAIETASELLALLACDLDLVFTDVIAGLHLFTKKCCWKWKAEKAALKDSPLITSSDGTLYDQFPPPHLPDWMNLQLASRYMDIGLGVFGWVWFIYRNPGCGCCRLFKRLTCCFPFRKRSQVVVGDNCCGCHFAGLRGTTSLPYEDMVHASFVDKVFTVPFFVCFDHDTSAVVVSCRGTFSPDDVLTDVAADFEPMDVDLAEDGAFCHKGILEAAREVRRRLLETEILKEAFKEKSEYRLVVTGHSLGAAVASILTLLLRRDYPDVKCFAFAPPPTLSRSALPLAVHHVFVLVYGNDSVPYLNYENVKGIIQKMVKCLNECQMHKYKVLLSSHKFLVEASSEEKLDNPENVPKTNGIRKESVEQNKETFEDAAEPPFVTESVYVAGTILHISPTDDGYRLRLSSADDYSPLSFRPNSIKDHFPQYLQRSLRRLGTSPVLMASDVLKNSPSKNQMKDAAT